MAGCDLQRGDIKNWNVSDDQYWSFFNFFFSDSAKKTNTYKFAFLKSILDNLFNAAETEYGSNISYFDIFEKFTENYWNLVVKDDLIQTKNSRYKFSRLEIILKEEVANNPILKTIDFSSSDPKTHRRIVNRIKRECSRYVVGALYNDLGGCIYSFDLKGSGITIARRAYEFMLKYKTTLEKLNYFAWAKYLEGINPAEKTPRLLDTLELATPRRNSLTPYRDILINEHHDTTCFYCGKKLNDQVHVDHAVPWSFVKDDKIWNFVLACPHCNESKNNKLPPKNMLPVLEKRNHEIRLLDDPLVISDMRNYTDTLLYKMWDYAEMSGFRPYTV